MDYNSYARRLSLIVDFLQDGTKDGKTARLYAVQADVEAMRVGAKAIKTIMSINTLLYTPKPTPVPAPQSASIPHVDNPAPYPIPLQVDNYAAGEQPFKPGDAVTWKEELGPGFARKWKGTYACMRRKGTGIIYDLSFRTINRGSYSGWQKSDRISMEVAHGKLTFGITPVIADYLPEVEAAAEPEYGSIVYWLQTIHHGNTAYKDVFRGQYVGLDTVERVQVRSSDEEWIGVGEPGERVEVSASLLSLNEPEINAESFSG